MSNLDHQLLGRQSSFFNDDYVANVPKLSKILKEGNALILGGAGSIGSEVVELLSEFQLNEITVIDIDENSLTELTRKIRNNTKVKTKNFNFLPLDMSSQLCLSWLAHKDFTLVMNFAALKHVRTEKNPFTALALFEANVIKLNTVLEQLIKYNDNFKFFSVSSDKSVNPSSFMGLSKRFMEHLVFQFGKNNSKVHATSARFANVLFSNGSLPFSWKNRITRDEPIACPENCQRYFITHREAAELCVLSANLSADSTICVPRMNPANYLIKLENLAEYFVIQNGMKPKFYSEISINSSETKKLRAQGYYPIILTELDTMGEKPFEEFYYSNEVLGTNLV